MKSAIAYMRVSTDGQIGENKFGLDAQRKMIEDFAAANDYQIVQWYIEERGVSGVSEDRPQFNALLQDDEVHNPPIEALLVAKSDRVARDMKLYYYYLMLLSRKNINLISVSEPVPDYDTGMGNIYLALMLFVAEQERKNITMRTMGGKRRKAATGGYIGGYSPYGYHVENKGLVVYEPEAALVRYIFKLRAKGLSLSQIQTKLTDSGYKTRKGTLFQPATINNILKNEKIYRGQYRDGQGNWIEGKQDAILED